MADLTGKVLAFCDSNDLLNNDAVVIGLSGGPDSVALFYFFTELRSSGRYGGGIYAVHINHGLRPGDCDEDERFVSDLCSRFDVPLRTLRFDISQMSSEMKRTEEETGRIVRYREFEKIRQELASEGRNAVIAVAHHADDLAETFLMNLFRGSGLEGLTGIKARNGSIIRPFLSVTKNEILEYLGDREFRTDHTNQENDHTRNIWRNLIIPEIAKVSVKQPESAIRDTSSLLAVDSDFISEVTYKAYDGACVKLRCGREVLDTALISVLHPAIRSRVIRRLYLSRAGTLKDFETVNLKQAEDMALSDAANRIDMPGGMICFVQGGLFGFSSQDDIASFMADIALRAGFVIAGEGIMAKLEIPVDQSQITAKIPNSDIQIQTRIIENCDDIEYNGKSWFCPLDEVSGDLFIRTSAGNLDFARAGSGSSKQIRRIFTDLKVPREVRDLVAAIADDSGIVFIPGIGHGKGFVSEQSMERCLGELPYEPDRILEVSFIE